MENLKGKNPPAPLDKVDRMILKHLQENAKFDMKMLSDLVNMTKTPIYKRIIALEETGYIKGYVALIDRKLISTFIAVFSHFATLDKTPLLTK